MAEAKENKKKESKKSFKIILPFKGKGEKNVTVETDNEKIIDQFAYIYQHSEKRNNKVINPYYVLSSQCVYIKSSFFAGNKRVQDVWRYNIIKNEGKYKLQELSESECPFCCSKYIDRNPPVINKNICLLIIESPHKDEYCRGSEFIPVAPAQGTTGENIEKYFCKIINANKELHEFFQDGMQLVVCNPVQFQTSLFALHGYTKLGDYSELKAQVWYELFEKCGEKKEFIERVKKYEPKVIINACTCTGKVKLSNYEKTLKEIVSDEIIEWKRDIILYEAELHPSAWLQYNKKDKNYEIQDGFYRYNKEMKAYFDLLRSAKMLSLNKDGGKLKELSKSQMKIVDKLLNSLLIKDGANKLKICLRGDKYSKVKPFLNLGDLIFDPHFYKFTYMLGEKSASFKMCANHKIVFPYRLDIGVVRSDEFEYVFDELHAKIETSFSKVDEKFKEYFRNAANKTHFVDSINTATEEEKLVIRDYYFWMFHTSNADSTGKISYFVSTSTSPARAKYYEQWRKIVEGTFCYMCFIPEPITKYAKNISTNKELNLFIRNLGLPTYTEENHPEDEEISVKAAIFPHFIIGIYEYETNRFVVNQNLFLEENRDLNMVLSSGMYVD